MLFCFRQAMHLRFSEHAKPFGSSFEAAKSKICLPQLQISRQRLKRFRAFRELTCMAAQRRKLAWEISAGSDELIRFCSHIVSERLYIDALCAVKRHDIRERRKKREGSGDLSNGQMVGMTFGGNEGIGRKDDLRLYFSYDASHLVSKCVARIIRPVGEREKANISDAELCCGCDGFRSADPDELFRRRSGRRIIQPITAVCADEKADFFPAAVRYAAVAPAPISISSGCGPIIRKREKLLRRGSGAASFKTADVRLIGICPFIMRYIQCTSTFIIWQVSR